MSVRAVRAAKAHVDESSARAESFGIAEDLPRMRTRSHAHRRHQLLYAVRGSLLLVTSRASWLLPAGRAAFLPAGVEHRVRADGPVDLRTVYLAVEGFEGGPLPEHVRVFDLPPLGRELVLFAMRFEAHAPLDAIGARTFALLRELCAEWSREPRPFDLPMGSSDEVRAATAFVRERIELPLAVEDVARHAGLSVRTLHRRFAQELELGFRDYLGRARVLAAMAHLDEPDARVAEVAARVGFESVGAFTRAFRRLTGESPRDYRKRESAHDVGRKA
jgi:AraC-like DNA-binding protein/mannose-6-phosphate isomerase-like protein (cupin superfamily)